MRKSLQLICPVCNIQMVKKVIPNYSLFDCEYCSYRWWIEDGTLLVDDFMTFFIEHVIVGVK